MRPIPAEDRIQQMHVTGSGTGDLLIGNIKMISFRARLEWDAPITDFLVGLVLRLAIVKVSHKAAIGYPFVSCTQREPQNSRCPSRPQITPAPRNTESKNT
jgi:hypothetical protein